MTLHYDAIKQKGYRQKVIKDIEKLTVRYSPLANNLSLTAMSKTGAQYWLSKDSVARYLRIHKLIPELKRRLDAEFENVSVIGGAISIRTAVALSYLNGNEQRLIENLLVKTNWRMNMRKA